MCYFLKLLKLLKVLKENAFWADNNRRNCSGVRKDALLVMMKEKEMQSVQFILDLETENERENLQRPVAQ